MPIGASTCAIYLAGNAEGAERSRAPPLPVVTAGSRTEVGRNLAEDVRPVRCRPEVLEREGEEDDLEGVRARRVGYRKPVGLPGVVLELRRSPVVRLDLVLELLVRRRLVERDGTETVTDRRTRDPMHVERRLVVHLGVVPVNVQVV